MDQHDMMRDVQERMQSAGEWPAPIRRPAVRVRLMARIGENVIDIEQDVPLGDTTPTTIEHVQALACDPFMALLHRLIDSHFRSQAYRLSELGEDLP